MSDLSALSRAPRVAAATLIGLALLAGGIRLWPAPAAADTAIIPGNLLALPQGARVLDPLPGSYSLHLIVGLAPRHADLLDAYTRLRTAHGSTLARRALTPAQFADLFSPTSDQVAAVASYLRGRGLRITRLYPDRLLMDVQGTASRVEAAFGVSLVRYRDRRGRVYFANATVPRLPTGLAALVSAVVGLRNDGAPRHGPLPRFVHTHLRRGPGPHAPGLPPASQLTPNEIRSAYDVTPAYTEVFSATGGTSVTAPMTGTGQTVAVYELSPYNPDDIAAYDSAFDLGASPPISVAVDGGATDTFGGLGTAEAAMDVELVQAVAPGAQILVYNGPASPTSTDSQGADDTYAQIVNDDRAQVLSTSWGQCEPDQEADTPPDMTLLHNLFAQAVAEGMTVVAASGDSGANDCTDNRPNPSVDYPASDPNVLAVGGTTLDLDASGRVVSETGWSGSGGGLSAVYARPTWQAGLCLAGPSMRAVPDVALNAGTSYAVWVAGGWTPVNGTSAATPVWAALVALASEAHAMAEAAQGTPTPAPGTPIAGLGNILPQIYALGPTSVFHDVVTGGSNGVAAPGVGWDEVTGWGVPDAYALLRALIATPPPAATPPAPCATASPAPSTETTAPATTATVAPTATAAISVTPTITPTRTAGTGPGAVKAIKKPRLIVRAVPPRVVSGGLLLLEVRGASGAHQSVIFDLFYPDKRSQRALRMTDARGTAAIRLRVLNLRPRGHSLLVRLSATVRNGRHMLIGWGSFRLLPLAPARRPIAYPLQHDKPPAPEPGWDLGSVPPITPTAVAWP